PELHLWTRGSRPLLPRLRRAHGAFRCGAAGTRASGVVRSGDRGDGCRGPTASRTLRAALRRGMPEVLRQREGRAHRELRAGPPAHFPRGRRPLAALRALAWAAEGRVGSGTGCLSGRAGRDDIGFAWRGCESTGITIITG